MGKDQAGVEQFHINSYMRIRQAVLSCDDFQQSFTAADAYIKGVLFNGWELKEPLNRFDIAETAGDYLFKDRHPQELTCLNKLYDSVIAVGGDRSKFRKTGGHFPQKPQNGVAVIPENPFFSIVPPRMVSSFQHSFYPSGTVLGKYAVETEYDLLVSRIFKRFNEQFAAGTGVAGN